MVVHRSEMGQQIRTSCVMLLAEELKVNVDDIQVIQADGDKKYGDQNTDGSKSARKNFTPLRLAGAQTRELLISAAAKKWKIPVSKISASEGVIKNSVNTNMLHYQELGHLASKQVPAKKPKLLSTTAKKSRIVGKFQKGLDNEDIVRGKIVFGMDVEVEGMIYASLARAPAPWASNLKSFDKKAALSVSGVKKVVQLEGQSQPINTNDSVAVVATRGGCSCKLSCVLINTIIVGCFYISEI